MCSPRAAPTDGRYGENPNRLQHYYQYQVLIKPSPPDMQDLYLGSLQAIGIDASLHDIRFVEDDWESPTLGAWGLGWEVWCDGMEVSQFTYFQQVGGHDCHPVSGELTYGLERLAMYVLGVDHVMDMPFNDPDAPIPLSYGDVFRQTEEEYSRWNFDVANTEVLLRHFEEAEAECDAILSQDATDPKTGHRIVMAHPAYDQCIKASHIFNLLDARGVISVTERQAYIGRVRALARKCADAFCRPTPAGRPRDGQDTRNFPRPRAGLIAGVAMYYLQVYHFYEEVPATGAGDVQLTARASGAPEPCRMTISGHRRRQLADPLPRLLHHDGPPAELTETYAPYPAAEPLNAPFWFDCFDAEAIGEALEDGRAQAFLGTARHRIRHRPDRRHHRGRARLCLAPDQPLRRGGLRRPARARRLPRTARRILTACPIC